MELLETRFYPGKNIYCYKPVLKGRINLGNWTGCYTDELRGFAAQLARLLPGLVEHKCSRGYRGGFLERLEEGTYLGHVLEHVALELLTMAGIRADFGKTLDTEATEIYEVIIEAPNQELGMIALRGAMHLLNNLLSGEVPCVEEVVGVITRVVARSELGPTTREIIRSASARGIPVTRLNDCSLVQLGYGKQLKRIQASMTDRTSGIAVDISCDKELTKTLLGNAAVPVAPGGVAETAEQAEAVALSIGFPVVVKPVDGHQGQGVVLNLSNRDELVRALEYAGEYGRRILVEKYISGKQYRCLVIGGNLVAVALRQEPRVVGDGRHSVAQLITLENGNPLRGDGHEKPLTRMTIDHSVGLCLAKQGLDLGSVPSAGQQVRIRDNANLSCGGTALDVTNTICEENRQMIERAVRIAGLDVAGVDVVAEDIGQPVSPGKGAIIEVNAAPGFRMHTDPTEGYGRQIGDQVINWLFPPGSPVRIPIVAVTGTNGKTTTTRMIGHILQTQGRKVGMTTSDGIYVGNYRVMAGDTTGPKSAAIVLGDPGVEVAVLETARGGIIRSGLGYQESDVAVLTNLSEDHLGQEGIHSLEELAGVKALVGEVVPATGYIVVNGDDPILVKQVGRFRGKVIYFTRVWNSPVVRRHLGCDGWAVLEKGGHIILAKGQEATFIMNIRNIPATYNGLAGHNVENALAAIAAAVGLGVEPGTIAKGLQGFSCNLKLNPGRMNIISLGNVKLVLDYGHNPMGFSRVIQSLRKLHQGPLTGVVGMPGDRRDKDIWEAGQILARGLDKLIIKEDVDLRGREPGEVAGLLKRSALEAGFDQEKVTLLTNETQGVKYALENARPGEMVVVFYEKLANVLSAMEGAVNRYFSLEDRQDFLECCQNSIS